MSGEEIITTIFQSFPPLVAAIIVIVLSGRWILLKTFEQVEKANQTLKEDHEQSIKIMQDVLSKHTQKLDEIKVTMVEMSTCLSMHINQKNQALEQLKEKDEIIKSMFDMVKDSIRTKR